jgi:hypothetical protein
MELLQRFEEALELNRLDLTHWEAIQPYTKVEQH